MGKIREITFSGIKGLEKSPHGDEINPSHAQETIKKHGLQKLVIAKGKDYLERVQLKTCSQHRSGDEYVALDLRSMFFHNGLEYKSFVSIGAFAYKYAKDGEEVAKQAAELVERDDNRIPGSGAKLFKEVYLGDINGDRLPDLLVITERGAGLVLYQDK